LGEVPEGWEVKRLKHNTRLLTQKTDRRDHPVGLENIEGWSGRYLPTETTFEGDGIAFDTGDILFGKLRPYLAKAYLAKSAGEAVGDFHVMRPIPGIDGRFVQYQILNREFIAIVDGSTFGAKMPRASWDFVGGMKVTSPPLPEQIAIAEFLDRETGKIDELVAEQRRLMELLKEKRQAVISHAVTKGLNPHAPMKPSGIEWLGDVPEHWEVSALKFHLSTINGFGFSSSDFCDDGIPLIRAGNIKNKSLTQPEIFLRKDVIDKYPRVILASGDIVISMVESDPVIVESAVGQVGIVPESLTGAVPNQNVVILREVHEISVKRFWFYTLCSAAYRTHLDVFSHKLANQSIISSSLLVCAKITCPKLEEQQNIVDFLDAQTCEFDTLTAEAQRAIDLLQERRTALISAAVTGQIDIRQHPRN
jgi:type I restriction enzyme, S subunit